MLRVVDQHWKDHLLALDHLKEGIGLRGYGQRDPLLEYKKESFELFTLMKERVEDQIVQYLFRLEPVPRSEAPEASRRAAPRRAPAALPARRAPANVNYSYGAAASGRPGREGRDRPAQRTQGRPQRSLPVRLRKEVQEVPRREAARRPAARPATAARRGHDAVRGTRDRFPIARSPSP